MRLDSPLHASHHTQLTGVGIGLVVEMVYTKLAEPCCKELVYYLESIAPYVDLPLFPS